VYCFCLTLALNANSLKTNHYGDKGNMWQLYPYTLLYFYVYVLCKNVLLSIIGMHGSKIVMPGRATCCKKIFRPDLFYSCLRGGLAQSAIPLGLPIISGLPTENSAEELGSRGYYCTQHFHNYKMYSRTNDPNDGLLFALHDCVVECF